MGLDERLFGWLRRKLRSLASARAEAAGAERRAELEPLRGRLRLLACALFGDAIEIHVAERDGGLIQDKLWLPARMDVADEVESNVLAYVYRVAFAAASRRHGYRIPVGHSEEFRLLASLLAVRGTVEQLEAEMPEAHALRRNLVRALRDRRPDIRRLSPRAAALEGLHQALLGQRHAELGAVLAAPLSEWIMRAAAGFDTPDELEEHSARLLGELQQLTPTAGDAATIGLPLFGRVEEFDPERVAAVAGATDGEAPDAGSLPSGTERQGQSKEKVETVAFDEKVQEDSPFVHVFEKVFTAEEYEGGQKNLDGADELAEQEEALSELDMRQVVRTRERAHSVYKADIFVDAAGADLIDEAPPADRVVVYDEWDDKKRRYLRDWCQVRVNVPEVTLQPDRIAAHIGSLRSRHGRAIRELRAAFEKIERQRRWVRRQLDGSELDIDALVDRHGDLMAARGRGISSGEDRLYMSRRRGARDLATLVLLDTSLSTDSWVDGRRVLDIARDSVLVLGEVLGDSDVQIGVGAFHSNTRSSCQYLEVKDFKEPWSKGSARLLSLVPTGYTRIGPALRHATSLLAATKARRKLILLLSDGKPMDYDRYEGRHGVGDVRQALREAKQQDVHAMALAVESDARFYLPQMFGRHGFEILSHPDELPDSLVRIHEQLLS